MSVCQLNSASLLPFLGSSTIGQLDKSLWCAHRKSLQCELCLLPSLLHSRHFEASTPCPQKLHGEHCQPPLIEYVFDTQLFDLQNGCNWSNLVTFVLMSRRPALCSRPSKHPGLVRRSQALSVYETQFPFHPTSFLSDPRFANHGNHNISTALGVGQW